MIITSMIKVSSSSRLYVTRALSVSSVRDTKQWRLDQGLSSNRNVESPLTDGPDYTFLDGRPTPLLHKQKLRMLKHQDYASQIVQLSSELDFAKDRYTEMQQHKKEERERIIANRLKPKGDEMLKKK